MVRRCRACNCRFTIASANHWYCDWPECVRKRRKQRRAELAAAKKPKQIDGSDGHLERAVKTGE